MGEASREIVERGYDTVADAYQALEGADAPWPRGRWLADLLGRMPAESKVLDLGCGSGDPAMRCLADAGHSVTGVDVSGEQLARASHNVPEAALVHGSIDTVSFADAAFDAVVSLYTIEHVPRELHGTVLARIHRWLRAEGWLLLTCEIGDEPGRVGTWLGVPMYLSHFDSATMKRLVRGADFDIVASAEETQLEGGRPIAYLWILARKRSERRDR